MRPSRRRQSVTREEHSYIHVSGIFEGVGVFMVHKDEKGTAKIGVHASARIGPATALFLGDYERNGHRANVLAQGMNEVGVDVCHCSIAKRNIGFRAFIPHVVIGSLLLSWKIFRMRGYRCRIVFIPEGRYYFFPVACALKLFGARIVIDTYDFSVEKLRLWVQPGLVLRILQALGRVFEEACFRRADVLLALTNGYREALEEAYQVGTPILVWPVWSHRTAKGGDASGPLLLDHDRFNVLYWGNYHRHHGVEIILAAARLIANTDNGVSFHFVGQDKVGKVDRFIAEARAMGLSNVVFHGRVDEDVLDNIILEADVCLGIFSSDAKSLMSITNKVFESLSVGKATITVKSPVTETYFEDGKHILLVTPDDPSELANAIARLRSDPELKRRLESESREFFWRDYKPDDKAKVLIEMLDNLASAAGSK